MSLVPTENCMCQKCKECCWHNPGWFGSKEEIIDASKILGLSVKDFCKEYLIREWWAGEEEDIEVPAPRRNMDRETEFKKKMDKGISETITKNFNVSSYNPWKEEEQKNGKGFVRASWGHNLMTGYACIFLTENNLCAIHNSKPRECRESFGCRSVPFSRETLVKDYWRRHQKWIKNIVGEEV